MISKIKSEAKKIFANSKGTHDWDHTDRVLKLCLRLASEEASVDLEVLRIAAILHDIGRPDQEKSNNTICHAERGAELARKILKKYSLPQEKIEKIIHCIETHRFRGNKKPTSVEAKILFDADNLDSIGAVGIGRAFLFSGEMGAKLHNKKVNVNKEETYTKEDTAYREYLVKLNKIKDRMLTKIGTRMSIERHEFMKIFFDRLNDEVDGKK